MFKAFNSGENWTAKLYSKNELTLISQDKISHTYRFFKI
jgi:hypothetical protein